MAFAIILKYEKVQKKTKNKILKNQEWNFNEKGLGSVINNVGNLQRCAFNDYLPRSTLLTAT